jgi:dinuclear metal center YbgI/SA1388 family protein
MLNGARKNLSNLWLNFVTYLRDTTLGFIMKATVADIIEVMGVIAPIRLAEAWDNVGLQVGQTNWPVKTIWTALDPSPDVVSAACQKDIDLLITHHPLIFKPLRSVDFNSATGNSIRLAAQNQLPIFPAHTNFDSAAGGINDSLARRIGLSNLKTLDKSEEWGLGRIGELAKPQDLRSFASDIKKNLGLPSVKVAGDLSLTITRAAVCSGSGSSLMNVFLASGAQVFISGDLHYHNAKQAHDAKRGLIDIGHFASEHLIIEDLARRLSRLLTDNDFNVTVAAYKLEKDPFISL